MYFLCITISNRNNRVNLFNSFLIIRNLTVEETGPLVVLREAWGGQPELKCKALSRHPIRFIFLKTIELTPTTESIETCAEKLVWLQKRHRERGRRSDIRYKYGILLSY